MGEIAVLVATIVMLVLIFVKVPIFVSMICACLSYFALNPDANIVIAAQRITSGIESTSLLACPFFIMAGVFFNYTGVTSRLVDFCTLATGRLNGGLAQANILLSTIMGGMSGSSNADAAMEAKILVPAMEESGLSKPFSTVITAFSSIITPLIPPGIGMILYGTLAGASIGKMFMWGLAIGIITCVTMMVFTEYIARRRGYKPYRTGRVAKGETARVLKRSWAALVLPFIIIGSIRIGIVSPSEAGAVAVIYSLVLGLVWREMGKKELLAALHESAVTVGSLMLIVAAASIYSWVLTKEQIPQLFANFLLKFISDKYLFVLFINLFLLVVGMLMEGASATIILSPLLAPVAMMYGIDLIHFGMIIIFNMSIGGISPPIGTLMFVTCGVTGCSIKDFLKESVPYFIYLLVLLVLISYVPFLFY